MTSQESINVPEGLASPINEVKTEAKPKPRRLSKGKLETIAMTIMAIGALMMFQPFTILLYNYSFLVILIGTLMFIIISHFSDD